MATSDRTIIRSIQYVDLDDLFPTEMLHNPDAKKILSDVLDAHEILPLPEDTQFYLVYADDIILWLSETEASYVAMEDELALIDRLVENIEAAQKLYGTDHPQARLYLDIASFAGECSV